MIALALLACAKLATVVVPILYKGMVDRFSDPTQLPVQLPLALLLGYGLLRVMSIAFAELRDAVFAKVAQRAIRAVALSTFRHLHNLALRFHLERQTGGLSRAIERGTKGIDFLLTFMLFNIIPTLLEIRLGVWDSLAFLQRLVRAGDVRHDHELHQLHTGGHGMAPQIPAAHERDRSGGKYPCDRQPAEL